MTSAPPDLLQVQAYLHDKTGQPWASLGIVHTTPQGGGYHEGEDLLIAAGTAPGPQYPGSDYSYTDSPRDLLPTGRLAGGNYASAFDFGGDFPQFLQFNAWMRARMLANDPRTRDVREMIYTLDGRTVRRIDRTGVQGDSGDSSHLSHTHFSFFRDSVGRRAGSDNFMGLIVEFFGGAPGQEDDMALSPSDWETVTALTVGSVYDGGVASVAPSWARQAAPYAMRNVEGRLTALLTAVLKAQGVAQADIDELQARPPAGFTDAQVKQLAAALAAEVDPAAIEATLVDVLGRVGLSVRPA